MKKLLVTALLCLTGCTNIAAAKEYSLELSDPAKPATLQIEVVKGSVTVQGYPGKTIEVDAQTTTVKSIGKQDDGQKHQHDQDHDQDQDSNRRSTKGLKKVSASTMKVQIDEYNNKVNIASATRDSVDLVIKVPFNSHLKIAIGRGGDIRVSDVSGPLELENGRGGIYAEDVTGPIIAETNRKDIEVVFKSLDQSTPSSLTSHRGSVDITLPDSVKAKVAVQTYRGEVYSGLDEAFEADNEVQRKKTGRGQSVTIGGVLTANVNGGGQTLSVSTYRGDIYVRKPQ